jgi:hypothetical protein
MWCGAFSSVNVVAAYIFTPKRQGVSLDFSPYTGVSYSSCAACNIKMQPVAMTINCRLQNRRNCITRWLLLKQEGAAASSKKEKF